MIIYNVYTFYPDDNNKPHSKLLYSVANLETARNLIQRIVDSNSRVNKEDLISAKMTKENNYTIVTDDIDRYIPYCMRWNFRGFSGFIIHRTKLYDENDI